MATNAEAQSSRVHGDRGERQPGRRRRRGGPGGCGARRTRHRTSLGSPTDTDTRLSDAAPRSAAIVRRDACSPGRGPGYGRARAARVSGRRGPRWSIRARPARLQEERLSARRRGRRRCRHRSSCSPSAGRRTGRRPWSRCRPCRRPAARSSASIWAGRPRRVRRLHQREHAGDVRRGHRRTALQAVPVVLHDRRQDRRAGRRDVDDAEAAVGEARQPAVQACRPGKRCTDETVTTPSSSVGMSLQPALSVRVTAMPSSGLVLSVVLCQVVVLVAGGSGVDDALVDRPGDRTAHGLLGGGLVGLVVAVVTERVDVVAVVRHVHVVRSRPRRTRRRRTRGR